MFKKLMSCFVMGIVSLMPLIASACDDWEDGIEFHITNQTSTPLFANYFLISGGDYEGSTKTLQPGEKFDFDHCGSTQTEVAISTGPYTFIVQHGGGTDLQGAINGTLKRYRIGYKDWSTSAGTYYWAIFGPSGTSYEEGLGCSKSVCGSFDMTCHGSLRSCRAKAEYNIKSIPAAPPNAPLGRGT